MIAPLLSDQGIIGAFALLDTKPRDDFDEAKIAQFEDMTQQVCQLIREFDSFTSGDSSSPAENSLEMVLGQLRNINGSLKDLAEAQLSPAVTASDVNAKKSQVKASIQGGLQAINESKKLSQFYQRQSAKLEDTSSSSSATATAASTARRDSRSLLPVPVGRQTVFSAGQVLYFLQQQVRPPAGQLSVRWDVHCSRSMKSHALVLSQEQLELMASYLELLLLMASPQWRQLKVAVTIRSAPASARTMAQVELALVSSSPLSPRSLQSQQKPADSSQVLQICENFLENSLSLLPGTRFDRPAAASSGSSKSSETKKLVFLYAKASPTSSLLVTPSTRKPSLQSLLAAIFSPSHTATEDKHFFPTPPHGAGLAASTVSSSLDSAAQDKARAVQLLDNSGRSLSSTEESAADSCHLGEGEGDGGLLFSTPIRDKPLPQQSFAHSLTLSASSQSAGPASSPGSSSLSSLLHSFSRSFFGHSSSSTTSSAALRYSTKPAASRSKKHNSVSPLGPAAL